MVLGLIRAIGLLHIAKVCQHRLVSGHEVASASKLNSSLILLLLGVQKTHELNKILVNYGMFQSTYYKIQLTELSRMSVKCVCFEQKVLTPCVQIGLSPFIFQESMYV